MMMKKLWPIVSTPMIRKILQGRAVRIRKLGVLIARFAFSLWPCLARMPFICAFKFAYNGAKYIAPRQTVMFCSPLSMFNIWRLVYSKIPSPLCSCDSACGEILKLTITSSKQINNKQLNCQHVMVSGGNPF